jgi:hypothetical protein
MTGAAPLGLDSGNAASIFVPMSISNELRRRLRAEQSRPVSSLAYRARLKSRRRASAGFTRSSTTAFEYWLVVIREAFAYLRETATTSPNTSRT